MLRLERDVTDVYIPEDMELDDVPVVLIVRCFDCDRLFTICHQWKYAVCPGPCETATSVEDLRRDRWTNPNCRCTMPRFPL
jgi:hypothetical protein